MEMQVELVGMETLGETSMAETWVLYQDCTGMAVGVEHVTR